MNFAVPDENVLIYETIFSDDLLGRNRLSERLSNIVDKIEDPLVIALDGRWGTGKSFFLRRWVGAHGIQNSGKALTVYFDAFASDYLSDPLPSLVASISNRSPKTDDYKLKKIKDAAIKFVKPAAKIGLAMATFGASSALNDLGDAAVTAIGDEAKGAADAFWKREEGRQAAMEEFKAAISGLTQGGSADEFVPLVIVIDELDRCRPDYALEVLETIKHFFSVPYVHFVLGVNLKALENSVKARYGQGVDATAYLQKFISFTMVLPDHVGDDGRTSSALKYVKHLGKKMGMSRHVSEETEGQIKFISKNNHVSIRDIGKIMSLMSLVPDDKLGERIYPGWRIIMISLLITKVVRPDLFNYLVNSSIEKGAMYEYFGASDESVLTINSEGDQNPNYEHGLYILLAAWNFIISNGKYKDENEDGRSVSRMFSQFGDMYEVRLIPRKINDEWLSDFNVK